MISSQFEISSTKTAAANLRVATNLGSNALFLSIFIVYVILRLIGWQQTVLVEDHDSLVYLDQIKIFRTFDLDKIINMGGFTTQFYPFFAAILSWPGWPAEASARLCSMLFSSFLFLSVLGIGNRIADVKGAAFGLIILTFSPILIPFSFSVLAEPSYVALIYTGYWVFWTQYENPKFWKAGFLGFIFGLAFLTRIEALLNLFAIPLLQGIFTYLGHRQQDSLKRFVVWTTLFVLSFSVLVGVQIWRVSQKFGYFAIDERQVWTVTRGVLDGKSYEEQINGLNFSPSQINVDYIRSHSEVQAQFASHASLKEIVRTSSKTILLNFNDLSRTKLNILVGPLGLLFFCAGLFRLYKSRRPSDGLLVLAFIALNLVGPLLYQVQLRYIAVIAPLMMLVEGIGIVYLSESLGTLWKRARARENTMCLGFLLILLATSALPLYRFYTSPQTFNGEYSPQSLREPARIVKNIAEKELLRPPTLSARKGYLIYYADARPEALPYTDLQGLARFCELNRVDFVFLEHRLIQGYPFLEAFADGTPPVGFALLHRGVDAFGGKMELYRFQKNSRGTSERSGEL